MDDLWTIARECHSWSAIMDDLDELYERKKKERGDA